MKALMAIVIGVSLTQFAVAEEFEGNAQPADVLVSVTKFARDLEAVRLYMGKPAVVLKPFRVEFAAPRHVYYQAQTLFWKTNRLGQEVAGLTKQSPPAAPDSEILPEDVLERFDSLRISLI